MSAHIRGGLDSKLPKASLVPASASLANVPEERLEAVVSKYCCDYMRKRCTPETFANALMKKASACVEKKNGSDEGDERRNATTTTTTKTTTVFIAADDADFVANINARLSPRESYRVVSLRRPPSCDFGYGPARDETCMRYAVADMFLLARNPGPLIKSTGSSFSDVAIYYRRARGRARDDAEDGADAAGPGRVSEGCAGEKTRVAPKSKKVGKKKTWKGLHVGRPREPKVHSLVDT